MSQAPNKVSLVIGGVTKQMTLLLGSGKSGTYYVDIDSLPSGESDGCVPYYFEVNSGASQMPADESYHFLTYGFNNCKRNIGKRPSTSTVGTTTTPTQTPSPTTTPTQTPSPTTSPPQTPSPTTTPFQTTSPTTTPPLTPAPTPTPTPASTGKCFRDKIVDILVLSYLS